MKYNGCDNSGSTMLNLYRSALVRYRRKDSGGAADTIRNMAKNLTPLNPDGTASVNFYKLSPVKGSIEDAVTAMQQGKTRLTLQILKHIHLEMHYGRLVA